MSDKGHTSAQLAAALRYHGCTTQALGSVVAADEIPPPGYRFPIFYIVNSSVDENVRGHWILLYISSPVSAIEYFDPLHKPPMQYSNHIDNYLKTYSAPYYISSTYRVQPSDSYNCGLYCCYVADKRCQNMSLSSIMQTFDQNDLVYNDNMVVSYFHQHILAF